MKKIVVLLSLFTFNALAGEILVTEMIQGAQYKLIDGNFHFQRESGRAWVEVGTHEGPHSDSDTVWRRHLVPGLSLEGNEIVLTIDGAQTVCGTIRRAPLFKYEYVKPSKNCKFISRTEREEFDDGFEIRTRKILKIYLSTTR